MTKKQALEETAALWDLIARHEVQQEESPQSIKRFYAEQLDYICYEAYCPLCEYAIVQFETCEVCPLLAFWQPGLPNTVACVNGKNNLYAQWRRAVLDGHTASAQTFAQRIADAARAALKELDVLDV